MHDIDKLSPREIGTAMVNGFSTRVLESTTGPTKMKVWLDTRYGLMSQAEERGRLIYEVKHPTVASPPASFFAVPSYCAYAAAS